MRKVFAVIAVAALVGATSSWATVVTNVLENHAITIKGKLSTGTSVTESNLSGSAVDTVSEIEMTIAGVTNDVIGHEINVSNVVIYLQQVAGVDLTTNEANHKFVGAFTGTHGSASNAVILLSGTSKTKTTNTTVSAKFQGVWYDGSNTVTGTVKSKK